jgi:hypothetical protein
MIVVIIQTFKNIHTIPEQCFHRSGGHFLLPMMLGDAYVISAPHDATPP